MRSVSPVIVGITPVLAVKPGLEGQRGGRALKGRELGLECLVHRHGPGDRPDGPAADAEVANRSERGLAQSGMVGEAQVVVGRRG